MKKRSAAFVLGCWLACWPAAGEADTNYGLAEYLLEGPDARAAGMGNAQVAFPSGVYGAYWNPAGLAQMPADTIELGGQYGILTQDRALNSLLAAYRFDFGALALGWINFDVAKIAAVDVYDNPLGEFSTYENTFLIAGGWTFNSRWRMGAAFKLLHQNLAIVQGFGYALDAAVLYRPLTEVPWLLGADLQNLGAVLSEDSGFTDRGKVNLKLGTSLALVPDPATLQDRLVMTLDMDWMSGNPPLLHAGAEYRIFNTVARRNGAGYPTQSLYVRTGTDRGRLAVGAGYRPDLYALDYAFLFDPFGFADGTSSHRLSLTFHWEHPMSTSESGIKPVENDTGEAFIPEPGNPFNDVVKTYYEEALQEYRRGNLNEALVYLQRASDMDPRQIQVQKLHATVGKSADLEMRRKRIDEVLLQACRKMESGDLPAAAVLWRQVLADESSNPEALQGLERVKSAAVKLSKTGQAAFAGHRWNQARRSAEDALALDPGQAEAKNLLARLSRLDSEQLGKKKKEFDFAEFFRKGRNYFNARKYAQAIEAWRDALKLKPGDPECQNGIIRAEKETDRQRREAEGHYQNGLKYYQEGRLDEAKKEWEETLRLAPRHEKAGKALKQLMIGSRAKPGLKGIKLLNLALEK